jgi:hypothetical protein
MLAALTKMSAKTLPSVVLPVIAKISQERILVLVSSPAIVDRMPSVLPIRCPNYLNANVNKATMAILQVPLARLIRVPKPVPFAETMPGAIPPTVPIPFASVIRAFQATPR